MRPDKKLASLLGLADTGGVLRDQYLLIERRRRRRGLVGQTIQFHGEADSNHRRRDDDRDALRDATRGHAVRR